jgi:hypothetical protein
MARLIGAQRRRYSLKDGVAQIYFWKIAVLSAKLSAR